jgi:hypothetical protein
LGFRAGRHFGDDAVRAAAKVPPGYADDLARQTARATPEAPVPRAAIVPGPGLADDVAEHGWLRKVGEEVGWETAEQSVEMLLDDSTSQPASTPAPSWAALDQAGVPAVASWRLNPTACPNTPPVLCRAMSRRQELQQFVSGLDYNPLVVVGSVGENETLGDTSGEQVEVGQIQQWCLAAKRRCYVLGCSGDAAQADACAARVARLAVRAAATMPTDHDLLSKLISAVPETANAPVVLHRVAFSEGAPKRVFVELKPTMR